LGLSIRLIFSLIDSFLYYFFIGKNYDIKMLDLYCFYQMHENYDFFVNKKRKQKKLK